MLELQHHAAVHISVTFGIVSHFSIAFAVNALVGNIVELNKFIFSPLMETEATLLIVAALEYVPKPTALNVKAGEICELNSFILSAEDVGDVVKVNAEDALCILSPTIDVVEASGTVEVPL